MSWLHSFRQWLFPHATTDALILAALQERAKCGLELHDDTGRSFARLYPALNRLEKLGVIGSYWDETPYPRHKYYYLKRELAVLLINGLLSQTAATKPPTTEDLEEQ